MKVRKYVSIAFSMLMAASVVGASAQEANVSDAKGMFFEQLNKSSESINTGLQYWIELNRGGSNIRVSNKYSFKTGDRIRFHVTPNINGFAYILLKSGSRGERAVLFPDEKHNEDNKVTKGREYVIPGDGFLTFDENPGQEKLMLLLSRQPLDAAAYLDDTEDESNTVIAANLDGSKDLIPTKIYVSYGVPHINPIKKVPKVTSPSTTTIASNPPERPSTPDKTETASGNQSGAKKTRISTSKPKKDKVEVAEASKPEKVQKPRTTSPRKHKKPSVTLASANDDSSQGEDNGGVTTVVKQDPAGMLHLDVVLEHK